MKIVASKPTITRKELEAVLDCLIQDSLATGIIVKQFETVCASVVDMKYALAVNTATAAYHCAFTALQVNTGDEIIIPSFFTEAPLRACLRVGATPVLVDIAEGSYHPSEEIIKSAITQRTKAVIIGPMFGMPLEFNYNTLSIPIILDISHAIGMDTTELFTLQPSIAIASFSPSMMITTEMGSMLFTNNSRYYAIMRDVRGGVPESFLLGYEYCMSDIHAAMGLHQLQRLKDFVKRRRDIAKIYFDALRKTPHRALYSYSEHCTYQAFPVLFDAPHEIIEKFFKKNGIEIYKPIDVPLHQYCKLRNLDFPHSDRLSKKLYSLPIYPTLTKREIEKVSRVITMFA